MATGCKHRTDSPCLICKGWATGVAGCMHTPGGKGTDTQGCHRCHAEVYNCDRDGLMSDRHPKWQRVEPGTVIPAGQPYRWEYDNGDAYETKAPKGGRTVPDHHPGYPRYFVDSSWKPPLVLPDVPTWGIAIWTAESLSHPQLRQWHQDGHLFKSDRGAMVNVDYVLDFIPLTDEQVARIEAAR